MKTPKFTAGLIALAATVSSLCADTTINTTDAYAWGANIGFLNWRGDGANGAIVSEYICSGRVWSANCGWIDLGDGTPANGIQYGNALGTDFGVNLTQHYISSGVPRARLRGYAYGANIGWINFESTGNPEVSLSTGRLSGYAYSANCGWINLGDGSFAVKTDTIQPGADTDGDGIADAFEFLYTNPDNLGLLGSTSDTDADGQSDVAEYLADTNPTDALAQLRIITFTAGSTAFSLTWTSTPTRRYRIESKTDLLAPLWTPEIENILPDGATTTRGAATPASPKRFLRVQALRPLTP